MTSITILARTDTSVTLSVADYDALVAAAEHADDVATLRAAEARETTLGKEAARADNLPDELVDRLLNGTHPVTIWREHRNLTVTALAGTAGMSRSYLAEIEAGKKPGSIQAYKGLADALGVTVDDLT